MNTQKQVMPLFAIICAFYSRLSRKLDTGLALSDRFAPFLSGLAQLYHLLAFLAIYVLSLAADIIRVEDVAVRLNRRVDEVIALYDTLSTRLGELASTAVRREELDQSTTKFNTLKTHLDDDAKKFNISLDKLHILIEERIAMQTRYEQELESVKKSSTRSISLLRTELALLKVEMSKLRGEQPTFEEFSSEAAREARKARILADVARRMEEKEKTKESTLAAQPDGSASTKENKSVQVECTASKDHIVAWESENPKVKVIITPPSPKRSPKKSGISSPKPLHNTSADRRAGLRDSRSTSLKYTSQNTATGKENHPPSLTKTSMSATTLAKKLEKPKAAFLSVQVGSMRTSSIPKFQQSKLPAPSGRFASTQKTKGNTKTHAGNDSKPKEATVLDKSSKVLQEVAVPKVNPPPPPPAGTGSGLIPTPSSAESDEDFPDDDFSLLPSLGSTSHLQESFHEASEILSYLSHLRSMVPTASVRRKATSDCTYETGSAFASTGVAPSEPMTSSTSTASSETMSTSSSRADFEAEIEESRCDFSAPPVGPRSSLDGEGSPVVAESAGDNVAVNEEETPCRGACLDEIQIYLRSLHTAPEMMERRRLTRAASLYAPPKRMRTVQQV